MQRRGGVQRKLKERAGAIKQVSLIVDTPSQSIRNVHRSPGTIRQIVVNRMKEHLDPKDVDSDYFEKISKKVSELTGVQLCMRRLSSKILVGSSWRN
jgi:hypothetical protein